MEKVNEKLGKKRRCLIIFLLLRVGLGQIPNWFSDPLRDMSISQLRLFWGKGLL